MVCPFKGQCKLPALLMELMHLCAHAYICIATLELKEKNGENTSLKRFGIYIKINIKGLTSKYIIIVYHLLI